mmetsp:Transcript_282/g.1046  ORF Transcript_282/g.1046 Transcript_282/m.1046 type:complete len:214 (+) Transcript_282:1955-2596(+)
MGVYSFGVLHLEFGKTLRHGPLDFALLLQLGVLLGCFEFVLVQKLAKLAQLRLPVHRLRFHVFKTLMELRLPSLLRIQRFLYIFEILLQFLLAAIRSLELAKERRNSALHYFRLRLELRLLRGHRYEFLLLGLECVLDNLLASRQLCSLTRGLGDVSLELCNCVLISVTDLLEKPLRRVKHLGQHIIAKDCVLGRTNCRSSVPGHNSLYVELQ